MLDFSCGQSEVIFWRMNAGDLGPDAHVHLFSHIGHGKIEERMFVEAKFSFDSFEVLHTRTDTELRLLEPLVLGLAESLNRAVLAVGTLCAAYGSTVMNQEVTELDPLFSWQ
jgi:hypothetical protein